MAELRACETSAVVVPRSAGLVEGQPLAKLPCTRPRVDEAVDVRVPPLPVKGRRRVRPGEWDVEREDTTPVGRGVLIP